MSSQATNKPVQQIVAAIEALDLESIKVKLMHPEAGEGWSREAVDALESDYKRFLTLHAKYPETEIVPSKEVDEFWHAHILDTRKYAEDCQRTFGYFIHHQPSVEAQAADETQRLHVAEFGAETSAASFCSLAAKTFCSLAAKKSFCSLAVEKAFCSLAAKKDAAFCSLAAKKSFCSLAAKNDAAFCSLATKKDAAFCSLAAKTSFCSLAAKNDASFCSLAAKKSFCSLAIAA